MVGFEIGIGATTTSSKKRASASSFDGSTPISLLRIVGSAASASAAARQAGRRAANVVCRTPLVLCCGHYRLDPEAASRLDARRGCCCRRRAHRADPGARRRARGASRAPAPALGRARRPGELAGARREAAARAARRAARAARRHPRKARRVRRRGQRLPSPLAAAARQPEVSSVTIERPSIRVTAAGDAPEDGNRSMPWRCTAPRWSPRRARCSSSPPKRTFN